MNPTTRNPPNVASKIRDWSRIAALPVLKRDGAASPSPARVKQPMHTRARARVCKVCSTAGVNPGQGIAHSRARGKLPCTFVHFRGRERKSAGRGAGTRRRERFSRARGKLPCTFRTFPGTGAEMPLCGICAPESRGGVETTGRFWPSGSPLAEFGGRFAALYAKRGASPF